jgi:PKD repeat protein
MVPVRPSPLSSRLERHSRGQAMVEFALVLPLLVLLLVMAVDFGRVFFGWVALQNAARIAADFAAQRPDAWPADNPLDTQAQDLYRDIVENDLQAINCEPPGGGTWGTSDVPDPTFPGGKDPGDPALVQLQCTLGLLTPLAELIVGGPVALGAEATFGINEGTSLGLPTPSPTPTPTPTPVLTPSPAPTNCTVPQTVGGNRNTARNLWAGNGFAPANLIETGSGNFTVQSQSQTANTSIPCNASMTISQIPGLTPAPTPSPAGPTPIPTPTPLPTPTPIPTPTPVPCQAPSASFTYTPSNPTRQTNVQFTSTSTTVGCPITSYQWNFGDNSAGTGATISHRFNYQGQEQSRTFTVTLIVINAAGSSQTQQSVTVTR